MTINLIFGNRKSGTTLLARLIDSKDVTVLNTETLIHTLDEVKFKIKHGKFLDAEVSKYFPYPNNNEIKFDSDRYTKNISRGLNNIKDQSDFIMLHIDSFIKSTDFKNNINENIFIKNVGGNPDKIFNQFLQQHPESKIISIRRNPNFIIRSIINDRRKDNPNRTYWKKDSLNLKRVALLSFEAHHNDRQQSKYIKHQRVFTLDFDDLRERRAQALSDIMNFCGIPFSEVNTKPTLLGKKVRVTTHSINSAPGKVIFSSKKLYSGISLKEFLLIKSSIIFFFLIRSYRYLKKIN